MWAPSLDCCVANYTSYWMAGTVSSSKRWYAAPCLFLNLTGGHFSRTTPSKVRFLNEKQSVIWCIQIFSCVVLFSVSMGRSCSVPGNTLAHLQMLNVFAVRGSVFPELKPCLSEKWRNGTPDVHCTTQTGVQWIKETDEQKNITFMSAFLFILFLINHAVR